MDIDTVYRTATILLLYPAIFDQGRGFPFPRNAAPGTSFPWDATPGTRLRAARHVVADRSPLASGDRSGPSTS